MRALVIRYRKLGDSLMVTPILRALAERGEIFAVGEAAFEKVFAGVSGFVPLSGGEPSRWELIQAGLRARRFRCDAALVLRFNRRASIVARLAGCRVRVGGTRAGSSLLTGLTQNVYDPAVWPHSHQVEKYYAVAEAACGPLPRYPTSYAASPYQGLPEGYVAVHVGNGGSNLSWPDASFAAVVQGLRARGMPVVATGADAAGFALARAASDVDLVGRTDLDALAGVFRGARMVLGLDGGGPRVSAAVGTPVAVLSIGLRWSRHQAAPWMSPGVVVEPMTHCVGCSLYNCEGRGEACVRSLHPERVVEAAMGLL